METIIFYYIISSSDQQKLLRASAKIAKCFRIKNWQNKSPIFVGSLNSFRRSDKWKNIMPNSHKKSWMVSSVSSCYERAILSWPWKHEVRILWLILEALDEWLACFIVWFTWYSTFNVTGKSLSEALIIGSNNTQYDKRLFIDLPVQYMKTKSSYLVVYTNSFFVLTCRAIYVHHMFWACSFHVLNW